MDSILAPVVLLVLWTLVMLVWGVSLRVALSQSAGDGDPNFGKRMTEAGEVLPAVSQYKIDNYNHLTEQPTLFYSIALTLAVLDAGSGINFMLAWTYVGLRIVHSLVHATTNHVMVRFTLFALATIPLVWLAVNAALLVF